MLIPVLLIVLGVVWIAGANRASGASPNPPGEDSAQRILRERFAKGEIDREEFETRRRELRS
jgi:putative membrane protein